MKFKLLTFLCAAMMCFSSCAGVGEQMIDLEISVMPTKVRYHLNDNFNKSGMVVHAIKKDGTRVEITDYTCDIDKLTTLGDQTINITYKDLSESIKVKVVQNTSVDAYGTSRGQQDELKNTYFTRETHTFNGVTIPYRKYVPTDSVLEKLPLVIMLHGAGERGSDNHSQLLNSFWRPFTRSDSLFLDSVIIAPQCPTQYQWVQTPWANGNYSTDKVLESEPLKVVVDLINALKNEPYIDSSRIYVTGLSMGGFGTWDLLARHPEMFAAGAPICGGGDPNKANILADIPILTFHGNKDDVVPYRGTNSMYNAIKVAGKNNIEFITFDGMGHAIWDAAFDYQKPAGTYYFEWFLFSKIKK